MSVENLNEVQDMRPRLKSRLIPMSQDVITTFDMGWLIPHRAEYLVPGDKVNIGHSCFFRFDPFMNPILSRANGKNYDFMIPERILYNETEYDKWFTGGINESDKDKLKPHLTFSVLYKFCYNFISADNGRDYGGLFGFNTLCDYLGLPVNQCYVPSHTDSITSEVTPGYFLPPTSVVNDMPILLERFLAYALVYREYFMWNHDETSVWVTNPYLSDFTKIPFGNLDAMLDSEDSAYDEDFVEFLGVILSLRRKGWTHDYFTSALPNIQSGDPAMIGGTSGPVDATFSYIASTQGKTGLFQGEPNVIKLKDSKVTYGDLAMDSDRNLYALDGTTDPDFVFPAEKLTLRYPGADVNNIEIGRKGTGTTPAGGNIYGLDLGSSQSGFTINDLRLLNAIQVYKERLNVGGTRLKEALYMQFGVTVPDDRLDRPDFVGFMDFPVQISEVLQTSQTTSDSVLGDQGGHGIGAASQQTVFNYFVLEPMIHLSIMAVLPDTYYMQGIDPFWSKVSRYDVWNPVFNHLSDQSVSKQELYFSPYYSSVNPPLGYNDEFGYLPRFAEYKATYNKITGNFRKIDSGYMSWHQGRLFGYTPELNQKFIDSRPTERIFAVVDNDTESSDPDFIGERNTHILGVINNQMKVARNVPSGSDPSLNID